jgi:phosphonopyruvate decarboxylase
VTTPLLRSDAVEALAAARDGAVAIVTMQAIKPWLAAGQGDDRNLVLLGSMGSASAIGLGIALARPDARVLVLDGDGSLLMQLGSLVTIAGEHPENLRHIVFENRTYETSGGQPVPGVDVADLCELARAAGYAHTERFDTTDGLVGRLRAALEQPGPSLISFVTAGNGDLRGDAPPAPAFPDDVAKLRRTLTYAATSAEGGGTRG